jgi:hypothetical protein
MREDEEEYSPSGGDDEEEYVDVRQYQSVEFYKAEKRLIDRYEEVSGGIKADISPDPLPLPQEMKKQKKNYEG